MLTLLRESSQEGLQDGLALNPSQSAVVFLAAPTPSTPLEAVLAQFEAKQLPQVPGLFPAEPAECCRTWICHCTRAVPHGSFL